MTRNTSLQADRADTYSRITDQIVKAIEAGAGDWKMPWHTDTATSLTRPVNAVSGKPYRGVNIIALWAAAYDMGYESNKWATYKQWLERGGQVRKGEKARLVVFWKFTDTGAEESQAEPTSEGEGDGQAISRRVLARGYAVFNAAQIEGYTPPVSPVAPVIERIERADQFFSATGATILNGGKRAYYNTVTDHIQMPPFAAFQDNLTYYATLCHETTHWTAPKPRLDRDMSGRFGSESYAAEELVAELGAAFLCADLGLANEPRPENAAYVASWLKVLKDDNRATFTAAARAQQAADYIHSLQPTAEAGLRALPLPQRSARPAPSL